MATSRTPTSAGSAADPRPEEHGFLVAGPGRAAEVAIVSLVEAGAVRISREGKVSAVRAVGRAWSPLQSFVLRAAPRSLGDLVVAAADSPEAGAMRQDLVERGFARPLRRRRLLRWASLAVFATVFGVLFTVGDRLRFEHAAGAFLAGLLLVVVISRAGRPLTGAGRAAVKRLGAVATTADRVALVAHHGLLGKVGRLRVWQVLGMAPAAAATLRRRSQGGGGSSCGSCSGSSCGGDGGGGDGGGGDGGGGCGGGGGGGD